MNSIKSIFLILISTFLFLHLELQVYSYSSFPGLETKVFSESNSIKIKKIQNTLKAFNLYNWDIDWKYDSVKDDLIAYQKKAKIIDNDSHESAWYFWVKTLTSLKKDFPDTFEDVTNNYLKMDEPLLWERYFYITAYYSPIPGQKRYTTWTYEWDIRLNWSWKITASWKNVFPWLLAAPRNYKFWTKILFDWLWVGSVEDRWWAIVNAWERWHEFDRIDIWMWYGDEWLERALKWWQRKVKWKIILNDADTSIAFDNSPVTKYRWLKVDAEQPKELKVKQLQLLFTDVWLYKWIIDSRYKSIKNQLIKFQIENNIITWEDDPVAWYFGDKTYIALRKNYWWGIFKKYIKKPWDDILLTKKQKRELNRLNSRINKYLDKKFEWNKIWSSKYKNKLKNIIIKSINKSRNKTIKKKLKYLSVVL